MIATIGVGILLAIVIVIGLSVGVIYALKNPIPSATTFEGPFPLTKRATAVSSSDFPSTAEATMYVTEGSATFQAFVYPDTLAQTAKVSGCGRGPQTPSCESGLYPVCECGTDCANCAHEGYRTLVRLYGIYTIEVLNVPDASRQNAVATQLTVVTGTATKKFVETIPLPPLNLQVWTMITLCHDGRRMDVYYNDALVSSSKTDYALVNRTNSVNFIEVGDAGLTGTIGLLRFYRGAATTTEVAATYTALADTRGNPTGLLTTPTAYSAAVARLDSGSLLSRLCLDGSCLPAGNLRAPAITLPQGLGEPTDIPAGSISTLYALESPYA